MDRPLARRSLASHLQCVEVYVHATQGQACYFPRLNRVMVAEVAELLAHYELISNASDVSFHVSLISDLLPHRLFGCFARGDVENQPCSTSKLLPSALVCGVPVTMIPDRAGGCCCIARLARGIPPTLTANRPKPSYLPDTAMQQPQFRSMARLKGFLSPCPLCQLCSPSETRIVQYSPN
jgi:hypothetical protein